MITRARALQGIGLGLAASSIPRIARSATTSLSVGQIGNNSVAFFPLYVAKSQGYFRDAGLDVNITAFQSGAVVGAAMTSGSLDIGCSVITDVFALLKAGRPVKIVGSLVDGYYVDVIGSNQFLAQANVSRKSPLHARVMALKGRKIGITGPGSGTEALVVYLFKHAGLDPTRDAELVNVGTDQSSIATAMKTGRIDAVSFAWPLSMVTQVQKIGSALIMPAEGDVPSMRGQVQGVMYVRPQMLAGREDAVVAFVKAIGRAQSFIHADRSRARALLKEYDAQLDDATIDLLSAAYLPVLPQQPRVAAASYDKALSFHRTTGYAGPSGDAYADAVATAVIDKALHS
jgi:NitT/TauT family transport system substrate-binding protein